MLKHMRLCRLIEQRVRDNAFHLRPGMKLSMHRFQTLLIDVRINLRRRNIGVAEHLLNDAQVRAVAQQVRREAVPEQMRINVFFQARAARFFLNDLPDPRSR